MGKRSVLVAACALALASSPAAAADNLVVNGDFENSGMTGWTVHGWGANAGGTISGAYAAGTGCVGYSCVHNSDGSINTSSGAYFYQDIATVAGGLYNLTFDFGAGPGGPNELAVLFGDATVFDQVNMSNTNTTYSVFNLLATGSTMRLMFLGRQDPSWNRLDNISLVAVDGTGAVPEPATWAMMLLGFAGIGWQVRRRKAALAHQPA